MSLTETEGELKRRMYKQLYEWANSNESTLLFRILDEAKKEFPTEEQRENRGAIVYVKWFQKWFGDV